MATIYIDLDGVLADFDRSAGEMLGTDNIYKYEFVWGSKKFWDKINEDENFFAAMFPKEDFADLWDAVAHLNPTILTALPSSNSDAVEKQKREWVSFYLGKDVPVITCRTKDKPNYCEPGDILIDDRAINRDAWLAKGGTYLVHTTAARTVAALQALGIIN